MKIYFYLTYLVIASIYILTISILLLLKRIFVFVIRPKPELSKLHHIDFLSKNKGVNLCCVFAT